MNFSDFIIYASDEKISDIKYSGVGMGIVFLIVLMMCLIFLLLDR